MRRKRSARKRKMRKKALYQAASLISIAAFGIAQVTPSSQAVFSYSATIKDGEIVSAFVFPETIEELVSEIEEKLEEVEVLKEQAVSVYGILEQAENSAQATSDNHLHEILETAIASQEMADNKVMQLDIYLAQARLEVQEDESAMSLLKVIEDGMQTATELMDSMANIINEIEEMTNQANVMIAAMAQAEAAALEKEMIAEIAKKALEGLTDANTVAADILAKFGSDFDLNVFQSYMEELAKSEADLQKALVDAENYMNELKAYVDGTKEVASPDVLEEAKANYDKVQQAIDSLKETMETTKTTNTEVQVKIEQEKQRQEEEAKRIEQERLLQEEEAKKAQELENQSSPAAGGGAANPQTPVEGEQPKPEIPPTEENPTPEVPVPGGGGGGTPNTGQPPVQGELPNPENPPVGEEQPKPGEPPMAGEQPNPNQPPVEGEQPKPDQPPVEGEEQNPGNPPAQGEQPKPDQPDQDIPKQPARPDDEDSKSEKEDGSNPENPSDGDGKTESEQSPNDNDGNSTEGTKEDELKTETETNKFEDTTVTEESRNEEATAPTNDEAPQSSESTTANQDSENNSNDNEAQSTDNPSSGNESIERDSVASFNIARKEKEFYSIDSLILNRRDEDDDYALFAVTPEIMTKDIQKETITIDNDHKVKINMRPYLWSQWNKKL